MQTISSHGSVLTRLFFSCSAAPQTPELLFLSPLGSCIHLCSSAAFYQSLQRPWKPFNKWKKGRNSNVSLFLKLNMGAATVSWYRATCSERAKERGWHLSLSHSFTLTHSLCQYPLLSQSISPSLTKPGCDDFVTAPQKRPILKLKCGVLVKGGWVGGLCAHLCVNL